MPQTPTNRKPPPAYEYPDEADPVFDDDEAKSKRKKLRIFLAIAAALLGYLFSRHLAFFLAFKGSKTVTSVTFPIIILVGLFSLIAIIIFLRKGPNRSKWLTTLIASASFCLTALPTTCAVSAWSWDDLREFGLMQGNEGYYNKWGKLEIPTNGYYTDYMIGDYSGPQPVLIIIEYSDDYNYTLTAYNQSLNPISTPQGVYQNILIDSNMTLEQWAAREYNLNTIRRFGNNIDISCSQDAPAEAEAETAPAEPI